MEKKEILKLRELFKEFLNTTERCINCSCNTCCYCPYYHNKLNGSINELFIMFN
jgi:hypothetical protein